MCMLLCAESCICVFVFLPHNTDFIFFNTLCDWQVWILRDSTLPCLIHFCHDVIGQSKGCSQWEALGLFSKNWIKMSEGHLLGRPSHSWRTQWCECKASHINFYQRLWPLCILRLSRVSKSQLQCCDCYYLEVFRVCIIKLKALSLSMCHFASCSNEKTALLVFLLFLLVLVWILFHQYFKSFLCPCPYFEIYSLFGRGIYVFLCFNCFKELIMPYRDGVLGK